MSGLFGGLQLQLRIFQHTITRTSKFTNYLMKFIITTTNHTRVHQPILNIQSPSFIILQAINHLKSYLNAQLQDLRFAQ